MAKDMTSGRIAPQLVGFTLPLVLGNLFQLLYNAVDSVIVGRFVGSDALAAVGTANPLMTLAILILNGLCIGAGVLVSTEYGARDYNTMNRQISTTAIAGIGFTAVFALACIAGSGPILRLLQVPDEVFPLAQRYLRIVFLGLVFTFLYNFFAATLRALGDSSGPLFFLMISAVLNVFGDLFFVVVLHWGSAGCALSTVLSEGLSCVLCAVYIRLRVPVLRLGRRWFVFDKTLLRRTVSYGWASAAQQGTVQLGKIVVQAMVNTLGISAMAAFTAVNRIDDFAFTPQQNIGHAMTTLLAQNKGAKNIRRMREGFACGMKIEFVYGLCVALVCFFGAAPLMGLFTQDTAVLAQGTAYLRWIAFLYLLPAATNGIQGLFRGVGELRTTLWASIVNMAVRAICMVLAVFGFGQGLTALVYCSAAGWVSMLAFELPKLFRHLRAWKQQEESRDASQ